MMRRRMEHLLEPLRSRLSVRRAGLGVVAAQLINSLARLLRQLGEMPRQCLLRVLHGPA